MPTIATAVEAWQTFQVLPPLGRDSGFPSGGCSEGAEERLEHHFLFLIFYEIVFT
jgi:hypothetical protein